LKDEMTDPRVTFYAVSDSHYFPAVVGLLNSLQLTGHSHEVIIGDSGLTPPQREQLARRCRLFPIPREVAIEPALLKAFPYLLRPDGIVVIIDSDMIVTGSLQESIRVAKQGKICAFADPERDRHFPEWRELFGLADVPRHQTYITTSYIAFSTAHWPNLLERWWRACEAIPSDRTMWRRAPNSDPFAQGDQEAFNALLMSEIPEGALHLLVDEERPIGKGGEVQVLDVHALSCTYKGRSVKLLHADGRHKPWAAPSFLHVRNQAYVRLLRRLLHDSELPLGMPSYDLPIWLRKGRTATAALWGLNCMNAATYPIISNEKCRVVLKQILARKRKTDNHNEEISSALQ
jgi:hypothetical protein